MEPMFPLMGAQTAGHDPRIGALEAELRRISSILDDIMGANGRHDGAVPLSPRSFRPAALSGTHSLLDADAAKRARARLVRQEIRRRRKRESCWPADLFADPAWDMLLDLYAATCEGKEVSVSSLCIAAAVPATTALRWIKTLVAEGTFLRREDADDRRRIFVGLSDEAFARMERYFDEIED